MESAALPGEFNRRATCLIVAFNARGHQIRRRTTGSRGRKPDEEGAVKEASFVVSPRVAEQPSVSRAETARFPPVFCARLCAAHRPVAFVSPLAQDPGPGKSLGPVANWTSICLSVCGIQRRMGGGGGGDAECFACAALNCAAPRLRPQTRPDCFDSPWMSRRAVS